MYLQSNFRLYKQTHHLSIHLGFSEGLWLWECEGSRLNFLFLCVSSLLAFLFFFFFFWMVSFQRFFIILIHNALRVGQKFLSQLIFLYIHFHLHSCTLFLPVFLWSCFHMNIMSLLTWPVFQRVVNYFLGLVDLDFVFY